MPENSRLHDVFNVSLVKKYFGNQLLPPPIKVDGEEEYEIEKIVSHRLRGRGYQNLIRWKCYESTEDCWLPERELSNAS